MILRIVRVRPPPSVQNYAIYFNFMKNNLLLFSFLFFSNCAYYNTFYNAEKYYKEAEVIINDSKKDNNEIPQQAKKLLSQSIEKSQKVLDKFPNSKYIDDSYFLIGKSSFIKGDFNYSEKYFRKLVNEFPNSNFQIESKLWISYTLLKNNYIDSSFNYISNIKDINLNDSQSYLKNLVLAEISLSKNKRIEAYDFFERAIEFSRSNSRKSSMYERLVTISEKNKDLDKLIYFLDRLNFYSKNEELKHDSKLKWLKYNRELGNLDLVRSEINTLLTRSDYEKIFLSLELEKIKILISESKNDLAKNNLLYIVENNSKKEETAESYYLLGLHYLTNEWDLDKSKEYFSNVKSEYSRSIFVDNSIELKNTIEKYQGLEKIFSSQQAGDTSTVEFTIDEEERVDDPIDMDYNFPNMMNDLPNKYSNPNSMYPEWEEENISSVVIKGTIDSLIFAMGEILYFDFQQLDSAKSRFNFLYTNYPESKFTPQALFILANTSEDSLKWKEKLFKEYTDNNFVSILRGEKIIDEDIDILDQKRDSLWNIFEVYPDSAAIGFIKLYESFKDPMSLYSGAFIYDNYLNDIKKTKKYYESYIENFSDSQFFSKVNKRLNIISEILEEDSTSELSDTLITQQNFVKDELMLPTLPPILKDINVPISNDSFLVLNNDSIDISDNLASIQKDSASTLINNIISKNDPSFDSLNVLPLVDEKEKNTYDLEPIYDWEDHIVKRGETLEKIALSYYNTTSMVDSLFIWNNEILVNKDLIYPYTLIKLKSIKSVENEVIYIDHVIRKGESLWSISKLIYNDPFGWKLLYNDNRASLINGENNLSPGKILKIRKILN